MTPIQISTTRGQKTPARTSCRVFDGKIDLGHRIEHCDSTNKVKIKRCARKKRHFYGLLFYRFLYVVVPIVVMTLIQISTTKGKKTLLGLMHDIHDKIDLGHRIEHCNSTNKVKIKRCAKKKGTFMAYFFLSILNYVVVPIVVMTLIQISTTKGKKDPAGLMHDIHDKIDLGHRFEHCNSKDKVKMKRYAKKIGTFSWLTFFIDPCIRRNLVAGQ